MKLAGTKAIPTGGTPSSSMSQKYACPGCPLPSAARPQKPIYAIDWHFFVPWAGNKYAIFRPVPIGYALLFQRKERAVWDLGSIGAIRAVGFSDSSKISTAHLQKTGF